MFTHYFFILRKCLACHGCVISQGQKNMQIKKYIYSFGYDKNESALCKLESRTIFKVEEKDKLLFFRY
ncbi:MAG: hypothetical protein ACJAXX_000568 [Roseivirga sp.]|jgi:hypothetical protein